MADVQPPVEVCYGKIMKADGVVQDLVNQVLKKVNQAMKANHKALIAMIYQTHVEPVNTKAFVAMIYRIQMVNYKILVCDKDDYITVMLHAGQNVVKFTSAHIGDIQ